MGQWCIHIVKGSATFSLLPCGHKMAAPAPGVTPTIHTGKGRLKRVWFIGKCHSANLTIFIMCPLAEEGFESMSIHTRAHIVAHSFRLPSQFSGPCWTPWPERWRCVIFPGLSESCFWIESKVLTYQAIISVLQTGLFVCSWQKGGNAEVSMREKSLLEKSWARGIFYSLCSSGQLSPELFLILFWM